MTSLVTSSDTVFKAATRVKSTRDKIMFETLKKNKFGHKIFYINLHLKDRLDIDFTLC